MYAKLRIGPNLVRFVIAVCADLRQKGMSNSIGVAQQCLLPSSRVPGFALHDTASSCLIMLVNKGSTDCVWTLQKTAVAVAHVKRGSGMIKLNGVMSAAALQMNVYHLYAA